MKLLVLMFVSCFVLMAQVQYFTPETLTIKTLPDRDEQFNKFAAELKKKLQEWEQTKRQENKVVDRHTVVVIIGKQVSNYGDYAIGTQGWRVSFGATTDIRKKATGLYQSYGMDVAVRYITHLIQSALGRNVPDLPPPTKPTITTTTKPLI
jgi:hypothetical protein